MKVCDVVIDSIWFDPRVRKQIIEYKNNKVDVVAIGYADEKYDKEQLEKFNCKIHIIGLDFKKSKSIVNRFINIIKRKKAFYKILVSEKPDIIHANDLNALILCYKAAKKLRCKLVYDSHEINTDNISLSFFRKKWDSYQEKKLIHKIDLMICVSNAAADYFKRKYNINRPLVVTNCSQKIEINDNLIKNSDFEILNHGQYYEARGYDLMINSIPLLKEYPDIKVAFRGYGKLEKWMREKAKEYGENKAVFYPPVLVSELIPNAAKSMVGVAITEPICLNFELSVSNKIFEYCSAGLPVIMSNIPEHRYLNQKYNFGIIIEENTPECFVEAILKLFKDRNLYSILAKNSKKLSEEINWENEFLKLVNIEKNMIE